MTLYNIDNRIREKEAELSDMYDEETGEIFEEQAAHDLMDQLNALDMERDEIIESMCLIRQEKLHSVNAIASEIDRLKKLKESAEREADRIKRAITIGLDGEKFKTDKVSVYYRKSHPVKVESIDDLAPEFIRIKREANKEKIGQLLRKGINIKGAHLESHTSTIIK